MCISLIFIQNGRLKLFINFRDDDSMAKNRLDILNICLFNWFFKIKESELEPIKEHP